MAGDRLHPGQPAHERSQHPAQPARHLHQQLQLVATPLTGILTGNFCHACNHCFYPLGLACHGRLRPNPAGSAKDPTLDGPPPRTPLFAGPQAPLTPKEAKGVRIGKEWAGNRAGPGRGDEGATVFLFGSTLPTIVCAPLYVCDLALQEGEAVNDLNVGDSVRWKITPATQGAGESLITHVMIKPTDVGLVTNLVITTNRRTYIVKLLAASAIGCQGRPSTIPAILPRNGGSTGQAFAEKQLSSLRQGTSAPSRTSSISAMKSRATTRLGAPSRLYRWREDLHSVPAQCGLLGAARPHRDRGRHLLLRLDSLFNGPTLELVNYRFTEHRFEADKVLTHARLSAGVGSSAQDRHHQKAWEELTMNAPASPDLLGRPPARGQGVRRLNRVPLMIAMAILALIMATVAYTYHARLKQASRAGSEDSKPSAAAAAAHRPRGWLYRAQGAGQRAGPAHGGSGTPQARCTLARARKAQSLPRRLGELFQAPGADPPGQGAGGLCRGRGPIHGAGEPR